jgi:predicted MFS family arabinose efflux permease
LPSQDRSILATAVPRITEEFDSLPDVGWYGSAYLLTSCCFQLLFGKLFAEFSIKWVYLAALGLFELGSLVCALAPNSAALIIGRAVAGLGSAGIFTGVMLVSTEVKCVHQNDITESVSRRYSPSVSLFPIDQSIQGLLEAVLGSPKLLLHSLEV